MNKYIKICNNKTQKNLRSLHTNKPNYYWKYLNSLNDQDIGEKPSLESLYKHFENVNNDESHDDEDPNINLEDLILDEDPILNAPFTLQEIQKSIKKLNSNKSPGLDNIKNEYIKYSQEKLLPVYVNLFNKILELGIFPNKWSSGVIIPIYKKNGARTDPENYRPITLLSCVSKLFTSVLNDRLQHFILSNDLLSENQAGFRAGYSITDHQFTLNSYY